MLNAISSSPLIRTATPSPAGLENQLARYQQQLSDCVNCAATSKTPEGRETARALSDRISEIKSRLDAVAGAQRDTPPAASSQRGAQTEPYRATDAPQGALGNHLNIYA